MNLQAWEVVCSFPQTLFDRGTPSVRTNILWHPFWETLNEVVWAESWGISMWQVHSSLREPGLGYEGQVAAQPSARLQCPPGELVFLLQLSPWGGHLLTTPDIEEWEQFPVRAPLPFCCPLPSTWGICLAELINLFNDVVSVFHIHLCPENLPTTVLPRKRAFPPGPLYELEPASLCRENDWHSSSGVGTGVGEQRGQFCGFLECSEWLYWFTNVTFLWPADWRSALNPFDKRKTWHFSFFSWEMGT